jgi:hypothetical protein
MCEILSYYFGVTMVPLFDKDRSVRLVRLV